MRKALGLLAYYPRRHAGFLDKFRWGHDGYESIYNAHRSKKYRPTVPLEGHEPFITQDIPSTYNVSTLSNGIKVITETARFPSQVNMGILMEVGARDETAETSGCLQALKTSLLKTLKNANETTNYCAVQMSGGDFVMDYDQERAYFKTFCMEHDVHEMFRVLSDCALEERSPMAINIAKMKMKKMHALTEEKNKANPLENSLANVLGTAYGYQTLGMPLTGFESNLDNLNAGNVNAFFQEKVLPTKLVFCANGITNHQEFVQLVEERTANIPPPSPLNKERPKAVYKGGEVRVFYQVPSVSVSLCFESVPWTHKDMPVFSVLQGLLGNATGFSMGGPGKGMHCRAVRNIFHKHPFVEGVTTTNSHFTDTGLFGLTITGAKTNAGEIGKVLLEELRGLKQGISEEELQRAKNILKINILLALERQGDRLEEIAKNYQIFGKFKFEEYLEMVEQVTAERVYQAVGTMFSKGKGTLVVLGGNVHDVESIHKMEKDLQ